VGIPSGVLPDNSPVIPMAYAVAVENVNLAIAQASPLSYMLAVYNLGASNVLNYAPDAIGAPAYNNYEDRALPYFVYYRALWKINDFVTGVVQSSGDNGSSVSLQLQEAFSNVTLEDLQQLKDPYGRKYLSIAQQFGTLWGLT
jgi:hypothetical protein